MKRFNIRVYGIAINHKNQLLVSDELIKNIRFTKFPGGGLEWGEGMREGLKREFMEEMNQPIEVLDHFYTTDYFQVSAFNPEDQLISVYFKVNLLHPIQFEIKSKPFDFPDTTGNPLEVQRWVSIDDLKPEQFKWPVDQLVAKKLAAELEW
ncbi:MAG: NUDIX domain-containing protein [Salibacteraceae bacterium]